MNLDLLQKAVEEIKSEIGLTVENATYKEKDYTDGLSAKTALIRSETLIQKVHEVTKVSLQNELKKRQIECSIHPPIGATSPELNVWGLLKKKKQDIVVLFDEPSRELIDDGPLKGQYDELGKTATKKAIVLGIRSQLSSVDKNFDTLMERAFAETLNLRLRHPRLVMFEVYMLAVKEYDEQQMKNNTIAWKNRYTKVEKFISIFNAMNHRTNSNNISEAYKYERSVLLLVDFSINPVKIYKDIGELKKDGVITPGFSENYDKLSPRGFSKDIIDSYIERHKD